MRRLALTLSVILAGGIAHADPQSDQLFDEGRKLLDAGDAVGACAKFDKAIGIDPTAAGTMLNLGLCNEKLTKYATALHWFRKAQTAAAEANPRLTQHEQVAKEHTAALAAKVATITITFTGGEPPANAKVRIDRADILREEFARAEVDPGHHVLDASAPGMKNVHQEFDVADQPGQGPSLAVAFVAGSNAITIDRGAKRRKIAIATAIGGVVLWGVAIGYGEYEKSKYCDLVDGGPCQIDKSMPVDSQGKQPAHLKNPAGDAKQANDLIDNASRYGTGIFVAGAVAIGVAAVVYFTAPQPEKIDQTVFVPTFDRDSAGFALSGHF
jgi:hypothetical protein